MMARLVEWWDGIEAKYGFPSLPLWVALAGILLVAAFAP